MLSKNMASEGKVFTSTAKIKFCVRAYIEKTLVLALDKETAEPFLLSKADTTQGCLNITETGIQM